MARRERSFITKLMKASMEFGKHCPECGEVIKPVRVITSERSPRTGAWRFNTATVMTCKCNSKEVFGG